MMTGIRSRARDTTTCEETSAVRACRSLMNFCTHRALSCFRGQLWAGDVSSPLVTKERCTGKITSLDLFKKVDAPEPLPEPEPVRRKSKKAREKEKAKRVAAVAATAATPPRQAKPAATPATAKRRIRQFAPGDDAFFEPFPFDEAPKRSAATPSTPQRSAPDSSSTSHVPKYNRACAFFLSAGGCHFGNRCHFSHDPELCRDFMGRKNTRRRQYDEDHDAFAPPSGSFTFSELTGSLEGASNDGDSSTAFTDDATDFVFVPADTPAESAWSQPLALDAERVPAPARTAAPALAANRQPASVSSWRPLSEAPRPPSPRGDSPAASSRHVPPSQPRAVPPEVTSMANELFLDADLLARKYFEHDSNLAAALDAVFSEAPADPPSPPSQPSWLPTAASSPTTRAISYVPPASPPQPPPRRAQAAAAAAPVNAFIPEPTSSAASNLPYGFYGSAAGAAQPPEATPSFDPYHLQYAPANDIDSDEDDPWAALDDDDD